MNGNGKVIGDNMTMQSAGGKARATSLSPERKSDIAAQGGKAKAEGK